MNNRNKMNVMYINKNKPFKRCNSSKNPSSRL